MPRPGSPRMPRQRRRKLKTRINEPFQFDFATISPSSEVQRQTRDETAMAIINTFQKCLDSPYLIEDKDAPARIGELLAKAGDRLEGSVNIQKTGQLDAEHVRKFELAQRLKLSPPDAVAAASAFVKRTLELLGQ